MKRLAVMTPASMLALIFLFSGTAVSQIPSRVSIAAESKTKTVIDMTPAELLRLYRKELSHLEFNPSQEKLKYLLENVGERVKTFFSDFSNTSAKERIAMQRTSRFGGLGPSIAAKEFNYLILPRFGKDGAFFEEYRTDKKNRPVDDTYELGAFIISSGYAGLCLYLHPIHQANSEFRYLGRETTKPGAHVIAFAQKPESGDYLVQYSEINSLASTRFLVQGFVWLDPDSCQIMRMRTSMQSPEVATPLEEQITDVVYESVQFENTPVQFWLPKEVNVSWQLPRSIYRNQHKYSDYHLFAVESEYKISQPKPNRQTP